MTHIAVVSVSSVVFVSIITATDAGSIQASFWRAITNTLSAGGNEAINTAVRAHDAGNGPSSNINANTISGWIRSFTATTAGTSQGTRPSGRSATVTPSTNNTNKTTTKNKKDNVLS